MGDMGYFMSRSSRVGSGQVGLGQGLAPLRVNDESGPVSVVWVMEVPYWVALCCPGQYQGLGVSAAAEMSGRVLSVIFPSMVGLYGEFHRIMIVQGVIVL